MRVANKYFGDNYFAIHSKTGFPKKETIEKPGFKPVVTDQKEESDFAKNFTKTIANNVSPKFLDYDKDAALSIINESNKLYTTKNPINDVFTLKAVYAVGYDSINHLELAASLFDNFQIPGLSVDRLKVEFALLGVTYAADAEPNRFSITFTGLENNLEKALPLINKLINDPVVEQKAVTNLSNEIISGRKTDEKQPATLGDAFSEYVMYGKRSSYIDRVASKDLKKLKAEDLMSAYKKAITYNVVWHFVGTRSTEEIKSLLSKNLTIANNKKEIKRNDKVINPINETTIYIINDKKAVQSQIYFLVKSNPYISTPLEDARINAFNQYMGGAFSGLILQEIREFRSLAYTASGRFVKPTMQKNNAYFTGYIGCQADKTNDAIETMYGLLSNMPQKTERIDAVRSLLKNSTSAYYPDFRYISNTIETGREREFVTSPLKEEYKQYDNLTFNDIMKFYEGSIKGKPMAISIYGNKSKMDLIKLAKYGKIVELSKKDIILE